MELFFLQVGEGFSCLQCPECTKALPIDKVGSRRAVSSQGLTGLTFAWWKSWHKI